jgi:hypothetical protein
MAILVPDIPDWLQTFRPTREAAMGSGGSGLCLDLPLFAVFVERWHPFALKDVKFTGSTAGH